jgi:hypothetical protein
MLWDYEAWYHSRVFIDNLQVVLKEVMMIHGTQQIGTKEKNQLVIGQGKSHNEVIFPQKKNLQHLMQELQRKALYPR